MPWRVRGGTGPAVRAPRPPVDGLRAPAVPSGSAEQRLRASRQHPPSTSSEALVTTPLETRPTTSDDVTTPAATHRRRGYVLLVLGLFQVWLWVTRLVNLVQDPEPRTTGFVVVHAVLYVAAFGCAFVLLGMGWRMWREARRP